MSVQIKNTLRAGVCALALIAAGGARATEGYFVEGVSARDQALGGAGIASPADALVNASNPAGLVDVGRQLNGDISLFNPNRGYNASGAMLTAPGHFDSGRDIFAIPALGYSHPIDADHAIGISLSGNGGMNTTYGGGIANATPGCQGLMGGGSGVFCRGRTGVDLNQALMSIGYAQRFGALSIGLAPVVGVQVFSAYGLGGFGDFGLSSDPKWLTNHSPSYSIGAGVRAGALYRVNDQLNVAVAGSTPIWSTPFENYTGLFAQHGSFDIPATIGVGVAYRIAPTFTVMVDYKHIFFSDVASVGDPMLPLTQGSLGSGNGPGFGWSDIDVVSVGVEYKFNDRLTVRAGYSHNTQPVKAANVMLNILAPGVVTDHIAGGFSYGLSPQSTMDFAVVYAPKAGVTGQEYLPGMGYVQGSSINISMSQLVVTLGLTYHFDTPAVVVAKY